MTDLLARLDGWLLEKEGENCEFKAATQQFNFDELVKYGVAIANCGGGRVILGVTDKRPRRVVGSNAFDQPERTRIGLRDRLRLNVDFDLIEHQSGQVLVFHIPSRPFGSLVEDKGIYWTRDCDRLVPMTSDQIRDVFAENGRDFSAEICEKATVADLDPISIEAFRQRWITKSKKEGLAALSLEQLLSDAELLVDGRVTYAALVLFGSRAALGRHLPQAELTFEYRSSDVSGPAQAREEYRAGVFSYYDKLWDIINLRNNFQHYQDGFFVIDVPTFSERSVREAILNAISHRDYQLGSNVFVRQYPMRIEIASPGGLPYQITLDNILNRQSPRNRRIADALLKCGLVERSGQGMNLMFEEAIRESKPLPDFKDTDRYQVMVTLHGTIQDPNFIRFLEKVGNERLAGFSTDDWMLLGFIAREERVPAIYRARADRLLDFGIIERAGKTRFILSHRFYSFVGRAGIYTRKKGLDRETNKSLLLMHIEKQASLGSPLQELERVTVPDNLSRFWHGDRYEFFLLTIGRSRPWPSRFLLTNSGRSSSRFCRSGHPVQREVILDSTTERRSPAFSSCSKRASPGRICPRRWAAVAA